MKSGIAIVAITDPDGNFGSITSEGTNVVLDPLQSEPLVTKSKIGASVVLQLFPREETKASDSVVDCNIHDRICQHRRLRYQPCAIV